MLTSKFAHYLLTFSEEQQHNQE